MKNIMSVLILVFLLLTVHKISAQTPSQWLNYSTANSVLPTNELNHIVVDNTNRKWIATYCSGLVMIDETGWHIFNSTNSELPSNCIMSLAVDNNQDLWMGGWYDNFNLARYDGSNWYVWNAGNSPIQHDYVQSITFDSTNKVWFQSNNPQNFGTANDLFSFDGSTTWNNEYSFTSFNGRRKILISGDSIIIATTNSVGKLLIIKKDGTHYEIGNFTGTYVTDLKKDFSGNIWIAAGYAGWGYLYKYDGISFTGFPQYMATSIEVDKENNVWIGTEPDFVTIDTLKLIKYNGTDWKEYTAANSPLPLMDIISDMAFDQLGNLWITTIYSGVYVFNENGIVPVELISFTATVEVNSVSLRWNTASETNNSGFEVERKNPHLNPLQGGENLKWERIGFVNGKGTTTERQFYSFVDENLEAGIYYYRLKQIDFDGSFEYSNIVDAEVGLPSEFSLSQNYPNPFNPTTKIKYSIPSVTLSEVEGSLVSLRVYDILGNKVTALVNEKKHPGVYEVEFDASQFSSGIYFYHLHINEFTAVRKMVLIK